MSLIIFWVFIFFLFWIIRRSKSDDNITSENKINHKKTDNIIFSSREKTAGKVYSRNSSLKPPKLSINNSTKQKLPQIANLSSRFDNVTNEDIEEYENTFDIRNVIQPINRFSKFEFDTPERLNFNTYPLGLFPKKGCRLQIPSQGRFGRKGYKEDTLFQALYADLSADFDIHDDCLILSDNLEYHYEPDIALAHKVLQLYIDIEIDEPYVGIDNIERDAIHFKGSDDIRNEFFTDNGWVVIRFAEIQVHQYLDACCRYVKCIIGLLIEGYSTNKSHGLNSLSQWTKSEALSFSREKFREQYLGIEKFNISQIGSDKNLNNYQPNNLETNTKVITHDPDVKYAAGVKEYTQTDNYDYLWSKDERLFEEPAGYRHELSLISNHSNKLGYLDDNGRVYLVYGTVTKTDNAFYAYWMTARRSYKGIKEGDKRVGFFTS